MSELARGTATVSKDAQIVCHPHHPTIQPHTHTHTHRAQHIFNFIPLFHPFLTTFYYSQSSSYRIVSYLISIHNNNNSNFFLSFIYFNVLIKRAVGAQLLKSRPAAKKDRRRSLFFKKWIQIFSFFFFVWKLIKTIFQRWVMTKDLRRVMTVRQ